MGKKWVAVASIIFLLLLEGATNSWAGSQSAVATVRVIVPLKAETLQADLPSQDFSPSRWSADMEAKGYAEVDRIEKDGKIIYTAVEKL